MIASFEDNKQLANERSGMAWRLSREFVLELFHCAPLA
jgi:hypothetical protein